MTKLKTISRESSVNFVQTERPKKKKVKEERVQKKNVFYKHEASN